MTRLGLIVSQLQAEQVLVEGQRRSIGSIDGLQPAPDVIGVVHGLQVSVVNEQIAHLLLLELTQLVVAHFHYLL